MKRILFLAIISIVGILAISGCGKQKTYDVVFDANGGTGKMQSQTLAEGESQSLEDNSFVNEGHTFGGWNTLPDGSGVTYSDGQIITLASDIKLYAQWTSNDTNQSTTNLNGHEYVDLGLPSGTKWATCNVGATNPEDYGYY
ncbi:MAG: InlB B-repeat-containing protein, partial [Bacteroidales bacterium]|nr:InlB B-repeat-containing protein [Bacteroidales bacterium]